MNTIIDDEEIVWLNHYVRNDKNGATSPYSYIKYTSGYEYTKDQYYSEENYDKWDEKYHLSKYNIPYKKGNPKLWIMFEKEQFVVDFPRQEVVSGVHIKDFQIHVSASRLIVHLFITHRIPTEMVSGILEIMYLAGVNPAKQSI